MSGGVAEQTIPVCPQCGTHVAPALLACPSCERLMHADELKRLAADAERAAQAGGVSSALAAWRQTLELLPPDSNQHRVISAPGLYLSRTLDCPPKPAAPPKPRSRCGPGPAA